MHYETSFFFMKALCIISDNPVTVKKHNYDW